MLSHKLSPFDCKTKLTSHPDICWFCKYMLLWFTLLLTHHVTFECHIPHCSFSVSYHVSGAVSEKVIKISKKWSYHHLQFFGISQLNLTKKIISSIWNSLSRRALNIKTMKYYQKYWNLAVLYDILVKNYKQPDLYPEPSCRKTILDWIFTSFFEVKSCKKNLTASMVLP